MNYVIYNNLNIASILLPRRQGRMQDFSGGGPNFKISGILDIQKLRAFVRGVWGYAPPRKFFKMVQFRGVSTTFMVKNPPKKL